MEAPKDLNRPDRSSNKHRFYALSVQRTLFGEWALVREWGRIGLSHRLRSDLYPSAGPAIDALLLLARQKARRGKAVAAI